jgi:hypothetical protein
MVVPPDTPTCRIKGIIKKVKFEAKKTKPTADPTEPYLPGRDQWEDVPAQYLLTVQILEVICINDCGDEKNCKEQYSVGEKNTLLIYQSDMNDGDEFLEGQVIECEMSNGYLTSYSLSSS